MVRSYLKILIVLIVMAIGFCHSIQSACAEQIRIIVTPVNVPTNLSSYSIYPNISNFIANDIINELNKTARFNVLDLNSKESLIASQGLHKDYQAFLRDYKDSKIIDYKFCGLLNQKLGIDKILLVSANFSLQNMILKQPLIYKLGFTEAEPIQSFYRLDTETVLIDTQTCLVDFDETYNTNIRTKNFDIPSNSLNDNIISTEKIKNFSTKITRKVAENVFVATSQPGYTRVNSNIISTTNVKKDTREGLETRDGHSFSTNNQYLKNKRIESFKDWVKNRVDL